jgi:hypothetical protein
LPSFSAALKYSFRNHAEHRSQAQEKLLLSENRIKFVKVIKYIGMLLKQNKKMTGSSKRESDIQLNPGHFFGDSYKQAQS